MSAPMDVLAVLDLAEGAAVFDKRCTTAAKAQILADRIHEARAAVAELIEAAKEFRRYSGDTGTSAKINASKRLDAALARIGGQS